VNISILQWNVWYKEDIHNIAKFLKETNADVVCLQELTIDSPEQTVQNTVSFIAEQLGYDYAHQDITFEDDDTKLANAVFSRFPITKKDSAWINKPTGTNHYDDEYRAYVEVTLDIDGTELIVGTVHMSYTDAFEPTDRKLHETAKLLQHIGSKTSNFILTGDFNAQPDSEVVKRIAKKLNHVGPDYKERTWTTKPFSYEGFEAVTLDWRLDYIFATPDIKVKSAVVLDTDFSDHLPIIARIEV
jgi:endonuclease/exonuclease/phosphatase family metal-dependent hydrolase